MAYRKTICHFLLPSHSLHSAQNIILSPILKYSHSHSTAKVKSKDLKNSRFIFKSELSHCCFTDQISADLMAIFYFDSSGPEAAISAALIVQQNSERRFHIESSSSMRFLVPRSKPLE